jgi:hypothetical protein
MLLTLSGAAFLGGTAFRQRRSAQEIAPQAPIEPEQR